MTEREFPPLTVILPWIHCISDNRRHALQGKRRRIVLAPAYRAALSAASMLVMAQRKRAPALPGPVEMRFTVYEPDRRRRDILNFGKQLADSLTGGGAIIDDSQIDRVVAIRGPKDKDNPRIELTVISLSDP